MLSRVKGDQCVGEGGREGGDQGEGQEGVKGLDG